MTEQAREMTNEELEALIAQGEARLTAMDTEWRKMKAEKQALSARLDGWATILRLRRDLGLSEKGIETTRQVLGVSGIPSQAQVGTPGASQS